MPKISIIVPVYNVEKYLSCCLDSIKAQTFTDWECILVDDGSSDNSGKICDEYANNDNRFVVIHQKNAGASAARNKGLDIAKGEYILFVDSDDWIENTLIEKLYLCIKSNSGDVSIAKLKFIYPDGKSKDAKDNPVQFDMPSDFSEITQGPCAKLIRKELLINNNILFPEKIKLAEDLYFMFKIFLLTKNVYGINDSFYFYYQNQESAIHTITIDKIFDEKYVIDQIERTLLQNKKNTEWFDWLLEKKILCKNKFLFRLKKPNVSLWCDTYPEINDYIIKNFNGIKKIYFIFAALKLKVFVYFLFYIRKLGFIIKCKL